jgi:hypothetical protein
MQTVNWNAAYRHAAALILGATIAAASGAAAASDMPGTLSGAQEVPPVTTVASGRSTIVVGADRSVTGAVETRDIDGTAAHIHLAAVGSNGPVVVPLMKTQPGTWSVPPGTVFTPEQYASYKAGQMYVNVHSAAHANGEIRVQLMP